MSLIRARAACLGAATVAAVLALAVAPVLSSTVPAQAADPAVVTVTGLTANGRHNPLGIPGAAPSLAWHGESAGRGVVQSAYQVQVATSTSAFGTASGAWDSGKTTSAKQVDVLYGGPALASQTRYYWRVRTWDGGDVASAWSDAAWFETGMTGSGDWTAAQWISGPAPTEIERWTDYNLTATFELTSGAFSPVFRATDSSNYLMWQLSVTGSTPQLRPHTKTNGAWNVLPGTNITSITKAALMSGQHTMSVSVSGNTVTTSLDNIQIDTRTDPSFGTTFQKGFVGFRASGTEEYVVRRVKASRPGTSLLADTTFANGVNPFTAGTVLTGTNPGLLLKGTGGPDIDALITTTDTNMPLLRKGFTTTTGKTLKQARVYATARGIYELRLNGQKVGDQHLAPGWTDYTKRFQTQTYDVTNLVRAGSNALGAELGRGWWAGNIASFKDHHYGTNLSLLARLRLDYTDGTSQWVNTDSSWKAHHGPYTFTDNIDGESYDARAEQAGWGQAAFDDSTWTAAPTVPAPAGALVPQPDEPVRTTAELPAQTRTQPTPGTYVYDLGQNMVGVARMAMTGQAGATVKIRYGEVLNPDGTLYTANLRSAKVVDYYTFGATGTVTYEPTFTQHGFRYVEITGASTPPATTAVTGLVWGSDLAETGTLHTSDAMLNQLQSNISWGQRGNFLSIPTDTPARDERLGWTGDINVFATTASYLRDTRAFLTKWMQDMHDAQRSNGEFPGVAPKPGKVDIDGGSGWSDAGITVPYALWSGYGDATVIRQNYDDMARFLTYVKNRAGADLIDSDRSIYGDWLHLEDANMGASGGMLGTAYFAEDARMMSEMAAALAKTADAATYAQLSTDIRAAFASTYIAADGKVDSGSQTAYAMAIGMGLVPTASMDKVAAKFVAKVAADGNHLKTGFLGTPWLVPALSAVGRSDVAWQLLLAEDYPSWGYEISKGATTMWERWNSIKPDGTFGDVGMNSFNHYAYGAIGDWMYRNIGGIAPAAPGYKKIRIAPSSGTSAHGVTDASGSYDSVYGTIGTDWSTNATGMDLAVDIPVNTTADVVLPAEQLAEVTEGGTALDQVAGVQGVHDGDGNVTVTIGSGHYEFAVGAVDNTPPTADTVPQITGTARYGETLTSTTGSWNTTGLTFTRQWLRDGVAISNATGATYRLVPADIGTRISVQVTATTTGRPPGTATSAQTAVIDLASSTTTVALSAASVPAGSTVTVTATLSSLGNSTNGVMELWVNGQWVMTKTVNSTVTSFQLQVPAGTTNVSVRFKNASWVSPSTSATVVVTGT